MKHEQGTFGNLSSRLRAHPPGVCLLLDSELVTLLNPVPLDPGLAGPLLAEALTRLWMYEDRCPEAIVAPLRTEHRNLFDAMRLQLAPWRWNYRSRSALPPASRHRRPGGAESANVSTITRLSWSEASRMPDALKDATEQCAWTGLVSRIDDFLTCDGLIAVVGGEPNGEAIPVPFVLTLGANAPGAVHDRSGQVVDRWHAEHEVYADLLSATPPKVVICCDCGPMRDTINGGSFALAVCLADSRKKGVIPDYPPLELLATGGISADGRLARVDAVDVKAALATRLNVAVFVHPDGESHANRLALPVGLPLNACLQQVEAGIEASGIARMTVRQAYARVDALQREIQSAEIAFPAALQRLDKCDSVFRADPQSEFSQEGRLLACVIRGAIANHEGRPDEARALNVQAANLALKRGEPMKYVDARAAEVVSLTDLGLLDEAAAAGRDLLDWASWQRSGDATTRLQARMKAHGVYGGQPLLQLGLQCPELASGSRQHLEQALEFAVQLEDRREIAFDTAQLGLWHALYNIESPFPEIDALEQSLLTMGHDGSSLQFIRCYRLLAGYRHHLSHRHAQTEQSANAPAPLLVPALAHPMLPASPGWLRALALKYRGTLRAAMGDVNPADEDFAASCRSFEAEIGPLLRFVGATAALQAGESLLVAVPQRACSFLRNARETFVALRGVLHGLHDDPGWIERADGLLSGLEPHQLPNPQMKYRY